MREKSSVRRLASSTRSISLPRLDFYLMNEWIFFFPRLLCLDFLGFLFSLFLDLQKIGFDEVSYTVDLKKGVVTEGQSPVFVF